MTSSFISDVTFLYSDLWIFNRLSSKHYKRFFSAFASLTPLLATALTIPRRSRGYAGIVWVDSLLWARIGAVTAPIQLYTSGAYLDLYPLLFTLARQYTGARLLREQIRQSSRLPSRNVKSGRKTRRTEPQVRQEEEGRDERGSNVAIVMSPVSLLFRLLLLLLLLLGSTSPSAVHLVLLSSFGSSTDCFW